MERLTFQLRLAGPFMATGLEASAQGVDAPFLRDSSGENFIIPGSQVLGVVRQVLTAMSAAAPEHLSPDTLNLWFGRPSGRADEGHFDETPGAWAPLRRGVRINDLKALIATTAATTLTRIAVDDDTGAVRPGHLQVLEQPVGIGAELEFTGTVEIDDLIDAKAVRTWLARALGLVPAIGANKSAGFGRIIGFSLGDPAAQSQPMEIPRPVDAIVAGGRAVVQLRFDGPFLISGARWNTNLHKGGSTVSGAVLKAVLAANSADIDADTLSNVVIRELRPAKVTAARPTTPSSSIYAVETFDEKEKRLILEGTYDALSEDPETYAGIGGVISFAQDWKPGSEAETATARIHNHTFVPTYYTRTRTAVDDEGVAATGKLFSYAAVQPGDHVWVGFIDQGTASAQAFRDLVTKIPGHLAGIGKTRVGASIVVEAGVTPRPVATSGRLRLVLETPACLHAPSDALAYADLSPTERIRRQYQDYFAHALRINEPIDPARLNLVCYANQRWVGGYLAARYRATEQGYQPWLITEAGSVFELDVPTGCEAAVEAIVARGLPLPAGFAGELATWRGNPFVPENGFGEVRLESVARRGQ